MFCFSSSFLERIDSVSMDDYTPTDQVSVTNGAGAELRHPFIWILYVIYFSPNSSWNRAYCIISQYSLAVLVMGKKEEEAFGGAILSFTVIICRSAIPVICLLFLLAFHFVSHKQSEGNRRQKCKSLCYTAVFCFNGRGDGNSEGGSSCPSDSSFRGRSLQKV